MSGHTFCMPENAQFMKLFRRRLNRVIREFDCACGDAGLLEKAVQLQLELEAMVKERIERKP